MSKPILNLDEVVFDDVEENGLYTSSRGTIGARIEARHLGYNLTVLPPGKAQCPFHCHHGEEEMFFILEGEGELRFGDQRYPVRAHDVIACPPEAGELDDTRMVHASFYAGFAENFDTVVHAAAARPTIFDEADGAVGELQNAERIVFGFGFVVVNVSAHLAVNGFDWRASQKKIAEGDAVAAEIHQRAASGAIDVPEPRAVRAKVFFALFDEIDFCEGPGIRHFFGF